MKEKITAILTLGCIFSLFFYYKVNTTTDDSFTSINNLDTHSHSRIHGSPTTTTRSLRTLHYAAGTARDAGAPIETYFSTALSPASSTFFLRLPLNAVPVASAMVFVVIVPAPLYLRMAPALYAMLLIACSISNSISVVACEVSVNALF